MGRDVVTLASATSRRVISKLAGVSAWPARGDPAVKTGVNVTWHTADVTLSQETAFATQDTRGSTATSRVKLGSTAVTVK